MPIFNRDQSLTWRGAPALADFVVPIDKVVPSDDNPRRGNVAVLEQSLARWGQTKPITVVVDGDTLRIVAGEHIWRAAKQMGWTHLAAIPAEFTDRTEELAFMLADNRTHDLGLGYDPGLMAAHLEALEEASKLEGTGYEPGDLDSYQDEIRKFQADERPKERRVTETRVGQSHMRLTYSTDERAEVDSWIRILEKGLGVEGASRAVYEGLKIAAQQTHQA